MWSLITETISNNKDKLLVFYSLKNILQKRFKFKQMIFVSSSSRKLFYFKKNHFQKPVPFLFSILVIAHVGRKSKKLANTSVCELLMKFSTFLAEKEGIEPICQCNTLKCYLFDLLMIMYFISQYNTIK